MTDKKIEDLPVMEDLSEEEAKKVKGGVGARKLTKNLGGLGVPGVVTSDDLNPSL